MKTGTTLTSMFARSPFKPLQKHMETVNACAQEVPGLFDALIADDKAALEKAKDAIFAKEEAADEIKNELRMHLPNSLFMPVDRRDLLELLDMQDSIADTAQDIAGLLVERDMTVPPGMADDLSKFVRRCVDTVTKAAEIIGEIDDLLASGFRGREAIEVETMVDELSRLESETDRLGMSLSRQLFKHEDTMSAVSVMFWYQLIIWTGDLADYAEKSGNRLRLLLAR
ncbi:MAG: TIGR00153 family protein [Sphingobacteriia bacterium]|nr:TIGR00153 family protein [Sphingobacteriia bacterium]NCC39610.1 TIGR00153 family protein [Gammaproteobacteria bacterium]